MASTVADLGSETRLTIRELCGAGYWDRLRWHITASMATQPLRKVFSNHSAERFITAAWALSERFLGAIRHFPRRDAMPRRGASRNSFARGNSSAQRAPSRKPEVLPTCQGLVSPEVSGSMRGDSTQPLSG